jgi:plastocyanin
MRKATRDRLVLPLLLPLGALVIIAIPVFGFSRILLSVSSHGATITALSVAVGIMLVAARLSSLPRIRAASLVGMLGAVAGIAMIAGGVALATIGSGEGGGPPKPPPPQGEIVAITAPVGAASKGFEPSTVDASPGSVTIKFDNADTSADNTHNVQVFSDKARTQPVSQLVPPFPGPAVKDIPVGTLKEGTYYFQCDVHPTTMNGTIVVKAGGAPGGAPCGGTESPGAPGGGGTPSTGGPPPTTGAAPPPGGTSAGPIDVTAQGLAFDKTSLSLPANTQVTIHFTNNDAGTPHNIGIYSADPATDPSAKELFKGDSVTGPASADYSVNPLPAGSYHFQCDFHPDTMKGTVTVG